MVEIKNSEDLKKWLEGKPKEYSMVIASRIALRVLPLVEGIYRAGTPKEIKNDLTKTIFRANLISWVSRKYPTHDISSVTYAIVNDAYDFVADDAVAACVAACDAAFAAAGAAYNMADDAYDNAAEAAYSAAGTAADVAYNAASAAIADDTYDVYADYYAADVELLEHGMKPEQLAKQPHWHGETSHELSNEWPRLKKSLLALDEDLDVWIDWYEDIVAGRNWAGLPDDLVEELSIQIAEQTNEWWQRDYFVINADIKKWLGEVKQKASERSSELAAKEF